jgi:hypothetical protein
VVVDDVEVDVDDVDVVDVVEETGDVVEATEVSTGAVGVGTGDVDVPPVIGNDEVVLESEEHARKSCDARSTAIHDDRCITRREDSA